MCVPACVHVQVHACALWKWISRGKENVSGFESVLTNLTVLTSQFEQEANFGLLMFVQIRLLKYICSQCLFTTNSQCTRESAVAGIDHVLCACALIVQQFNLCLI